MFIFDQPIHFEREHTLILSVFDNMTDQNLLMPIRIVQEGVKGNGSAEDPYRINNLRDLNRVHQFPDQHFILERDIDGNGHQFMAIGSGPIPFTGTFDGNGFTMTGLTLSTGGGGIFAVNNGTVKNVGMWGSSTYMWVRCSPIRVMQ